MSAQARPYCVMEMNEIALSPVTKNPLNFDCNEGPSEVTVATCGV